MWVFVSIIQLKRDNVFVVCGVRVITSTLHLITLKNELQTLGYSEKKNINVISNKCGRKRDKNENDVHISLSNFHLFWSTKLEWLVYDTLINKRLKRH